MMQTESPNIQCLNNAAAVLETVRRMRHGGTASDVLKEMERYGAKISKDTIRRHLKWWASEKVRVLRVSGDESDRRGQWFEVDQHRADCKCN